ncbi:hypothetical protein Q7P37_005742 [Cladosporium fusiforme]
MGSTVEAKRIPPPAGGADDEALLKHEEQEQDMDEEDHEPASGRRGKRKRRRADFQTSDRKYGCPEQGCGKKYSRLEHLYRHQLNHTPKQIYRCDHPECSRHFVRADLCARHKERHTAKGSHLQRKDAFKTPHAGDASVSAPSSPSGRGTVSASPVETNTYHQPSQNQNDYYASSIQHQQGSQEPSNDFSNHHVTHPGPVHVDTRPSVDPQITNGGPRTAYSAVNGSYDSSMMPPSTIPERRMSYDSSYSSRPYSNNGHYTTQHFEPITPMQHLPTTSPLPMGSGYGQTYTPPSSANYRSPTVYNSLPPLPPFGFQPNYGGQTGDRGPILTPPIMTSQDQNPMPNGRSDSFTNFNVMDMSTNTFQTLPVFNDEYGLNRSPPLALNEDFLASLLGTSGMVPDPIIPSPPGPEPVPIPQQPYNYNMPPPKIETNGTPADTPFAKQEYPGSPGTDGLDITMKESAVSDKKRLRLIELINQRFTDSEQLPDRKPREAIMEGCIDDPRHVMSLKMQRTFLASYWAHVHQQMPILHRPTFNPETCPDLLLIAMMCLGASCLERLYQPELTERCAELSSFLAYHVRWEVFKDVEFRPTAKLWTFQTMLLLEMFEKMYSTRNLHERAHIHHATTLIVMRRGSSLIGRSAIESPGHSNDPTRTPPGPDGSINTSGVNTPDATWNRWITAEATRRAAFAAFVIDSTHATLFGHSAVMAPHDIKLPLPCDEALWAATSGNEVQRVEASLAANGFKPMPFLEGLRRTLNGYKVRTNTFGRVILMAGLLNVSWHMNQRDLQIISLGVNNNALGSSMKWRSPLTRAFDFWRRDFDDSLSKNEHWLQLCNPSTSDRRSATPTCTSPETRDSVFESRTCLHSLAHMAMHVDMIDCTVFAGSERALGRAVTDTDRAAVQKRMRETWAPSARARDAVFYALSFLCEVLIPEDEQPQQQQQTQDQTQHPHPHQQHQHPPPAPTFTYRARADYLLNRPWVLYFAALIVWAYGYALDGPILPSSAPNLSTREAQIHDMRRFLARVGGVKSPEDLNLLRDRNSCLGLLMLLRTCFREPRWELLHEASDLLGNCVQLLLGPGEGKGVDGVGRGAVRT